MLTVRHGDSLNILLARLQADGWQLPALSLKIYARLNGQDRQVRSGDYRVEDCCASAKEFMDLLISGTQMTHRVTLVEGWDFRQVAQALGKQEKLQQSLDADPREAAGQLGMGYDSSEGLFYPDTYDYASGESDLDVLKRARLKQRQLLGELWAQRDPDLPYVTPYEAVILASIVEKEARLRAEAPRIAGVYVARLRRGMRLEADPTVIYGLGNDYSQRLTLADLRRPTPWNTYMNHGLPPTPIGLPGEEALRAALAPEESDMLYFVAKGDGSHLFSATHREHRQKVRQVRQARASKR